MDAEASDEDKINDWDLKLRLKLVSPFVRCKHAFVYDDILKDYLQSLYKVSKTFKNQQVLVDKISRHVKAFHLLYYDMPREQMYLYMEKYMYYMENILLVLFNLELNVLRELTKDDTDYEFKIRIVAGRLLANLALNLPKVPRRQIHILLKLNVERDKQSWKDVMLLLYNHYLNRRITNLSKMNFVRHYLLFTNWTLIADESKHEEMEQKICSMFDQTSFQTSFRLESVLQQQFRIGIYFNDVEKYFDGDELRPPTESGLGYESTEEDEIVQQYQFSTVYSPRKKRRT